MSTDNRCDDASIDFARADEVIQQFLDSPAGPPGLSYGVLRDGALVHTANFGQAPLGGPAPPPDSVYRIASVSKSFTAAAVLLLRDRGLLKLSDPVADYLPAVATLSGPEPSSPPVSIHSCLTMSAGLPTDDPWADRQESLSREDFDEMLASGLSFARDPDTEFEYSNLGYAILGRVVEEVSGKRFPDFVSSEFLQPLNLRATTYDYREVPDDRLVRGHRRRGRDWVEVPFSGPGAFSPIGGLLSSVRDLAQWVGGFLDAYRAGGAHHHPLSRATRLEMQQQHRAIPPELHLRASGEFEDLRTEGFDWGLSGYGLGLFVEHDLRWGTVVHHVGGYPGFSSQVRWHPRSGYGVVALTNGRYAPVWVPAAEVLRGVLSDASAPSRVISLWPQTLAARSTVEQILRLENAEEIAQRFMSVPVAETTDVIMAESVDLDVPADERAAEVLEIRRLVGEVRPSRILEASSRGPAHLAWWQEASNGLILGEVQLTPTNVPAIQSVGLRAVALPGDFLRRVLEALQGALAAEVCDWPAEIPTPDGEDQAAFADRLRDARRLLGECRIVRPVEGDSPNALGFLVKGQFGDAVFSIKGNEAGTVVEEFLVRPLPRSANVQAVIEPALPMTSDARLR